MIIRTEADKDRATSHIKALNIDKPWRMDIVLYRKNRSAAQNRLMWLWLTAIGNEIGYTEKEMYTIMADMFLPDVFIEYAGKQIKQKKSTSDLNTKEFTVYLESIDRWAAGKMGIVLPSPEDLIYEAMGYKKSI